MVILDSGLLFWAMLYILILIHFHWARVRIRVDSVSGWLVVTRTYLYYFPLSLSLSLLRTINTHQQTDIVASVMTWNAMTIVPMPNPIIAIQTSTSHNVGLQQYRTKLRRHNTRELMQITHLFIYFSLSLESYTQHSNNINIYVNIRRVVKISLKGNTNSGTI